MAINTKRAWYMAKLFSGRKTIEQKRDENSTTAIPGVHLDTLFSIVGPFLLGLLSVIGHYTLFTHLDGKLVDQETVRQSFVTNISLLLVTLFRLCMVGCVGLCFAQHLWCVLRQTALPVFRIEQLFCIRSKPQVLANPRVLLTTPLLFSMAVYIWFIELAAVYPPGALRVTSQPASFVQNTNISVINQPITKIYDPWKENGTYPLLCQIWVNKFFRKKENVHELKVQYSAPLRPLTALSKSLLSSGQIIDLRPPENHNLTYTLSFRAPQLSCATQTSNFTMLATYPYNSTVFSSIWDGNDTYILSQRRYFGVYFELATPPSSDKPMERRKPVFESIPWNATRYFAGEQEDMFCRTYSMQYNLNITYTSGVQHIAYTLTDAQPFSPLYNGSFIATEANKTARTGKSSPFYLSGADFPSWPEKLKPALESWNIHTLADAALLNLNYNWTIISTPGSGEPADTGFRLPNGTDVDLFFLAYTVSRNARGELPNPPTLLQNSVFDTMRYNASFIMRQDADRDYVDYLDPRDLNIREASLNALLTNLTISSLALGTQYGVVPVVMSEFKNKYLFEDRLSFFLPYLLCLGIALVYVGIGIRALLLNGVPAKDGGFLQIMMATRGRTEMERLVLEEGVVETGDLSERLLRMRVRFGELMEGEIAETGSSESMSKRGLRRAVTFGTVDETLPLRRREAEVEVTKGT